MTSWLASSLVTLSVILVADVTAVCEDGWSFFSNDNKCIKAFTAPVNSWDEGRRACTEQGARLLTIHHKDTETFVEELIKGSSLYYFIGLTDLHKEGQYEWIDGIKTTYTNWGPGQPDNVANEDCVHIRADLKWNDIECVNRAINPLIIWALKVKPIINRYICEKKGPGCEYNNGGCKDVCTDSTDGGWGVTCSTDNSCQPGYAMERGICYDVDECSVKNGGCDQICENVPGSWQCKCRIDFIYDVEKSKCVVDDDDTLIG